MAKEKYIVTYNDVGMSYKMYQHEAEDYDKKPVKDDKEKK